MIHTRANKACIILLILVGESCTIIIPLQLSVTTLVLKSPVTCGKSGEVPQQDHGHALVIGSQLIFVVLLLKLQVLPWYLVSLP